jgi:hypothetical protein
MGTCAHPWFLPPLAHGRHWTIAVVRSSEIRRPIACDPTLTIIGVATSFSSRPLQVFSLVMYGLLLIPGINLLPPILFFLALHIAYNWLRDRWIRGNMDRKKRFIPMDTESETSDSWNRNCSTSSNGHPPYRPPTRRHSGAAIPSTNNQKITSRGTSSRRLPNRRISASCRDQHHLRG